MYLDAAIRIAFRVFYGSSKGNQMFFQCKRYSLGLEGFSVVLSSVKTFSRITITIELFIRSPWYKQKNLPECIINYHEPEENIDAKKQISSDFNQIHDQRSFEWSSNWDLPRWAWGTAASPAARARAGSVCRRRPPGMRSRRTRLTTLSTSETPSLLWPTMKLYHLE